MRVTLLLLPFAQVRERRRVERTLDNESSLLSAMRHPNIVGFRAAQRLSDGHLCLALELCEVSLYALIQERLKPHGGCVSPMRGSLVGNIFTAEEVRRIGHSMAAGLAYVHNKHHILHGDVKSSNILLSRDLQCVKLCDLGVSMPLRADLSTSLHAGVSYEGTEPWRPPETLLSGAPDFLDEEAPSSTDDALPMRVCDRTDVFAFGLVLWEMFTGEVPHAEVLVKGNEPYRAALGTRPQLPALPEGYALVEQVFYRCTQRDPDCRPSAAELEQWLAPDATTSPSTGATA